MAIEDTDLERRVLAHEQILQVLIAHMSETEPNFLERLKENFAISHILGEDEQDYTGTMQYAARFINTVNSLSLDSADQVITETAKTEG